jgi:hypothetical protein
VRAPRVHPVLAVLAFAVGLLIGAFLSVGGR